MINRELIRQKVVQLLYAYLLSQSEFRIFPAPEGDSRDRRYAHRLYLDTLLLILELSGRDVKNRRHLPIAAPEQLSESRMVRSLSANQDLIDVMAKPDNGIIYFNPALEELQKIVTSSSAYRSYIRTKNRDIPEDVKFWTVIIRTVFAKTELFETCARKDPAFTMAGMQQGLEMAVETLESYGDSRRLFKEASVALDRSLDKAFELYHALLLLPVELTALQDRRLDEAKHKYLPTPEELSPSMKFVDNRFVAALAENADLQAYIKDHPFSWENDPLLLKSLLDRILESEAYRAYMEAPGNGSMEEDAELWRMLLRHVVFPSDDLAEALESKSVYWNDDLHIVGTFVLKTIRHFATAGEGETVSLLPKYKDAQDETFGPRLFVTAVNNREQYRQLIDSCVNVDNWGADRLAFMDVVVMTVTIAELMEFPEIPLPVTINEYVDIARDYGTPQSASFVNAVLRHVIKKLKEEGRLMK